MNKVVYSVSRGLTLTAIAQRLAFGEIAAITLLTNSTVPLSVLNSQTASFPNLQSSGSVKNQLVDTPLKAGESGRGQSTKESSRKPGNPSSDLESDSLVADKQAKYIQDKALKLESSLAKTVTLVKELEGFRSYAYIDSDGTAVIGYGMSVIEGEKVKLGDRISQVQAETALTEKLQEIQQQILAASTVELNSNQLVALTSFAFNVGVESLFKSTLFRKLKAGDALGAANEFPRWNKANMGRRLVPFAGLTKRRLTERNLFLTVVN